LEFIIIQCKYYDKYSYISSYRVGYQLFIMVEAREL